HVFALMHLLGFRFAPRIRDLGETKLYVPQGVQAYPTLRPLIGGTLNIKHVRAHWDDILRLASSIKQGDRHRLADAAQARQLPAPERTAVALRELGRSSARCSSSTGCKVLNQRRVHAGLNKGEARNSQPGRCSSTARGNQDRSEQQRYRASGSQP
ncbi:Tn3 family transposase, partial [Escherichia coli]|nr:Tn3 family transposase [Escherichia coli]